MVAAARGGQPLIALVQHSPFARLCAGTSLTILGLIAVAATFSIIGSRATQWHVLAMAGWAILIVLGSIVAPTWLLRQLVSAGSERRIRRSRLSVAGWCCVTMTVVSVLGLGIPAIAWLYQGTRPAGWTNLMLAIPVFLIGGLAFAVCALVASMLGLPLRRDESQPPTGAA